MKFVLFSYGAFLVFSPLQSALQTLAQVYYSIILQTSPASLFLSLKSCWLMLGFIFSMLEKQIFNVLIKLERKKNKIGTSGQRVKFSVYFTIGCKLLRMPQIYSFIWFRLYYRQTYRQVFYWLKESHYRLICHINDGDICTCIYKIVNLLKNHVAIYMVWHT